MLNKISDKLMQAKTAPSKLPKEVKPMKPLMPKQKQKMPAMPMPGTTPRKFPGLMPKEKGQIAPKKKLLEGAFQKFRGQFKDKRLA